MNILIKFPSRGRPDKFKDTFSTYANLASNLHNIQFVCSFDEDDILMNNIDIKNFLDNCCRTKPASPRSRPEPKTTQSETHNLCFAPLPIP